MKERQQRPQDIEWQKQKLENHRLNEALLTGRWHGSMWRRGIMARLLFRGALNDSRDNKSI